MRPDRLASLQTALAAGATQRAVLFVNHVLWCEPAALSRLAPHAGRRFELHVSGAPAWWPAAPLLFEISRAGLLDADVASGDNAPDLLVTLDSSDLRALATALLAGRRPAVSIQGDAAFATDVSWVIDHVRWDAEADLEAVLGPVAARGIARVSSGVAAAALGLLESLRRRGDPAR